ncbi:hypothetical protein LJC68_10205 [Bacteroidales bacterium OttesenSCG-928-B11]|nr:hypothetical protein [Bacteroidales bacterium OttesenSCG-928-E04]MDL2313233.1 hypothetical protein [Bacteroidales bacterium OttesenSCG-928-B11]
MNIVNERPGAPVQELKIEIVKSDYYDKVESALKKQRQRAVVPGFRQGNAPMGMIKKMYYKNFLAEEVNELISKNLFGYLEENKINIILEPLAIDEKSSVDFDNSEDFTFVFEFAVKPEFDINYEQLPEVKSFKVNASEKEISDYIENLRKRFGNYTNPETVEGEDDFITVTYGDEKTGFIHYGDLNTKGKKLLSHKKVNEEIEIPVKDIFDDPKIVARFLKLKEEDLEADNSYLITGAIENIGRMDMAELNEEFFKKAFPDGSVNSEKELKAKATEMVEAQWKNETDRYFINNAIGVLLDNLNVALPDEFVKRYLVQTQQDITREILDNEYEKYSNTFRWQLIENKIAGENNIQVNDDDIKNYVRDFFYTNYFAQFNKDEVAERLDSLVDDALKNREDVRKIYDTIFDKKVEGVLREKMKLNEQTGDFNEFIAFATGETSEGGDAKPVKKKTAQSKTKKVDATEEKPAVEETAKVKTTKAKPVKAEGEEEVAKKKTTKKTTKKEE